MGRLGLDLESVRRLLLRLGDSLPGLLASLRAAVAARDVVGAAAFAHTVAGAAGNLGAAELRRAARDLENAARGGRDGLEALLAEAETRAAVVSRSIDALREAVPASPRPAEAPTDPARDTGAVRAALERLLPALDECDASTAGAALAEADAAGLDAVAAEEAARLRDLVETCEYEGARAAAERLLGRLREPAR